LSVLLLKITFQASLSGAHALDEADLRHFLTNFPDIS